MPTRVAPGPPRLAGRHPFAGGLPPWALGSTRNSRDIYANSCGFSSTRLVHTRTPRGVCLLCGTIRNLQYIKGTMFYFIATNLEVETVTLLVPLQKNFASSWIDGSVLYGEGIVWAHCLRSFSGGQLMTDNSAREYPGLNHIGVPLDNYPDPLTKKPKKPSNMWSKFV